MKNRLQNLTTSFKETITISRYSILMYFRDKTAIFFSLFIPVMLMGVFGLLNLGGGIKYSIVIVDEAKNQFSSQVTEAVKKVDIFVVTEGDKGQALSELEKSQKSFVLIIPEGFGKNLAPGAQSLTRVPVSSLQEVKPEELTIYYDQSQNMSNTQVGFTIFDKIFDGLTHQIARVPNYFEIKQIPVGGGDLRYIDYIIPGLVAMSVMQLSIFAVTSVMVSWKERGILKRLLATPIHPSVIIFSQITARIITTLLQAALLIAMGIILFDLVVKGSIPLVVLLIVLGGLIFLSLGFALSGVARTQNTVAAIAQLVIFPQMFLSGIFFPREGFPDWLERISDYFPLTYFSEALRNVMVKGYTISQIQPELIGMSVWAVVMFILAVRIFKWE